MYAVQRKIKTYAALQVLCCVYKNAITYTVLKIRYK